MYALLARLQRQGKLDGLLQSDEQSFLPNVTGTLIGMSRSDVWRRIGAERDTSAKALCDWLVNNRSPRVVNAQTADHFDRPHVSGERGRWSKKSTGL